MSITAPLRRPIHWAANPVRRTALAVTAALVALATYLAPSAAAAPPQVSNCGASADVVWISTEPVKGPDYIIHLKPTDTARAAHERHDVVSAMWHQIQSCVPGLSGMLADSVWQQLECHQMYSNLWTGPTYDLETWHAPLRNPGAGTYANSKCLGTNWILGQPNGSPGSANNFPGYLDLQGSYSNIG